MRLRYVKNAYEIMEKHDRVVTGPTEYKGKWNELFNNNNPIHVEFGSGRGGFIAKLAETNTQINYLAFERNSKVIIKGLNKLLENHATNFYFVHSDVKKIEEIFEENEVEKIYLNFSDPWPKKKHAKRRLTHRRFLRIYEKILIPKGEIHFKSDNDGLFDFSLEEFRELGWDVIMMTRNLHNSQYVDGNIMTEYEEKFAAQGISINKLIAVSPKKKIE